MLSEAKHLHFLLEYSQLQILRSFENSGCGVRNTPSPVPRRLMKTPPRATLSPKGARVGSPLSWFLGARQRTGMTERYENCGPGPLLK
jgi:hypothetical protein